MTRKGLSPSLSSRANGVGITSHMGTMPGGSIGRPGAVLVARGIQLISSKNVRAHEIGTINPSSNSQPLRSFEYTPTSETLWATNFDTAITGPTLCYPRCCQSLRLALYDMPAISWRHITGLIL